MMSASIFERTSDRDFIDLIDQCGFSGMRDQLLIGFHAHKKAHKTGVSSHSNIGALEEQWYASLLGEPDYSVYSDPVYICDIWLCWTTYSRKGLLALINPKSLVNRPPVQLFGSVRRVLDLGCGFGYTTAGLAELFPDAEVMGTQFEDSFQYAIAEKLGDSWRFKVRKTFEGFSNVDLIYASEYFEHIHNPIEHLTSLIRETTPRYLVIANGFNGRAIGHFHHYRHLGRSYPANQMSKMFWKALRRFGYSKIPTKIWNNRPSIWQLRGKA